VIIFVKIFHYISRLTE